MYALAVRLLGPIFAKEMVEVARRKRYYAQRVLLALALFGIVLIFWAEYGSRRGYQTRTAAYQSRMASEIFLAVVIAQYVALWLFIPPAVSGLIAAEREKGSLDLLFTTHLTDREITLGKLASRVGYGMLVLLGIMPVVALLTLFGGVSFELLVLSQLSVLVTGIFVGARAIHASATTRTGFGALVKTYASLALLLAALPAGTIMVLDFFRCGPRSPQSVVLYAQVFINPPMHFACAVEPDAAREFSRPLFHGYFTVAYLTILMVAAWWLWQATLHLRDSPKPSRFRALRALGAAWRGVTYVPRTIWNLLARPIPIRNPEVAFGCIDVEIPFWLRARRALVYDRDFVVRRVQWAGVGVLTFFLLLTIRDWQRDVDVQAAFALCSLAVLAVGIALLAAASIVGDRQRGFFEQVLVSPATPWQVIQGTIAAVFAHCRIAIVATAIVAALFLLVGKFSAIHFICAVLLALVALFMLAEIGVLLSLTARSMSAAIVLVLVAGFWQTIGVFLTGVLCGEVLFARTDLGRPVWIVLQAAMVLGGLAWLRFRPHVGAVFLVAAALPPLLSVLPTVGYDISSRREGGYLMNNHGFWLGVLLIEGPRSSNFFASYMQVDWRVFFAYHLGGTITGLALVRLLGICCFDYLAGRSTARGATPALFPPPSPPPPPAVTHSGGRGAAALT
ncbi:MAG TPA: hypothetical protein VNC50_15290 [Planctomycetia bacterium]|nr:hypothetical protein [Planctomycetia bacterium]